MINKWQAAYEIIRYTKYVFSTYDSMTDTIWLKNSKSKSIMILADKETSDSEIETTTENLFYNKSNLDRAVNFEISKIYVNYIGSHEFKRQFSSNELKVSHIGVANIGKIIFNPFYKIDTKYKKPKSKDWYKKRVLSSNPLETYLIKFTPITSILLMINTLIFLMNLFYIHIKDSVHLTNDLGLTHFGVNQDGEFYRLISSAFLHANVDHFLFNVAAIYVLGKFVESIYGSIKMLLSYLITAVVANIISLVFITDSLSLGASGAAYGLMGILLVHLLVRKKVQKKLIFQVVAIFVVIGVLSNFFSNVNHYAHLGGAVYGVILGIIYNFKKVNKKLLLATSILAIVFPIVSWIIQSQHSSFQPYDEQALRFYYEKDYDQALSKVNETFKYNNETSTSYYVLGKLYEAAGDKDRAEANLSYAFELDPENELALKERLYRLRKNQDYEGMKELVKDINVKKVKDEELAVILEDLEYR